MKTIHRELWMRLTYLLMSFLCLVLTSNDLKAARLTPANRAFIQCVSTLVSFGYRAVDGAVVSIDEKRGERSFRQVFVRRTKPGAAFVNLAEVYLNGFGKSAMKHTYAWGVEHSTHAGQMDDRAVREWFQQRSGLDLQGGSISIGNGQDQMDLERIFSDVIGEDFIDAQLDEGDPDLATAIGEQNYYTIIIRLKSAKDLASIRNAFPNYTREVRLSAVVVPASIVNILGASKVFRRGEKISQTTLSKLNEKLSKQIQSWNVRRLRWGGVSRVQVFFKDGRQYEVFLRAEEVVRLARSSLVRRITI